MNNELFKSLEQKTQEKRYQDVLKDCLELLNSSDVEHVDYILDKILKCVHNNFLPSYDQIRIIKPFIESLNNQIQDLAFEIYFEMLKRDFTIISKELPYCIDKLNDFDLREKFLELFIQFCPLDMNENQLISKSLLDCVKDTRWKIRMKIVGFFNSLLSAHHPLIKNIKTEFLIMLDERDLDIIAEILDFLLDLIVGYYTANDLEALILSISRREWPAQEKILWIIEKIALKEIDIIKPFIISIIKLLDHHDHLVQKRVSTVIINLMDVNPTFFDSFFYDILKNKIIDNINEIEHIIKISILSNGSKRGMEIFNAISLISSQLIDKSFVKLLISISNSDPQVFEDSCIEITKELVTHFSESKYCLFQQIFKNVTDLQILIKCFSLVDEPSMGNKGINDVYRKRVLVFFLGIKSELGFLKINNWIIEQIKNGPVKIEDLFIRVAVDPNHFMEIVNKLINGGFLDAIIIDDKLQFPISEGGALKEDIAISKQWKIEENLENNLVQLTLSIKLTNNSDKNISKISCSINFANKSLLVTKETFTYWKLEPQEFTTFSWEFDKNRDNLSKQVDNVKLLVIYQKDNHFFSLIKKTDVLLL